MRASGKANPTIPSDATLATVKAFVAQARPTTAPPVARTLLVVGGEEAAARVAATIAGDLNRELVRVPLFTLVSKSVGEAEKHLERVFDAAAKSHAILLFDEADALFGKRSDVKDGHDRYANVAADDLMRRIASHAGVAILATRSKPDLDATFVRRLAHVVDVDPPH